MNPRQDWIREPTEIHTFRGDRTWARQTINPANAKGAWAYNSAVYSHRHWYRVWPISARNLYNDIPDQVVDTLLAVCKRNAPLFERYFRLKARCQVHGSNGGSHFLLAMMKL